VETLTGDRGGCGMTKTRVLVVDDSALMRRMLSDLLGKDPQIEVVGSAPDPIVAADQIKALAPDVLTLDVEMPRMDGLTFLEKLMRLRPTPVVMVSSLTEAGCATTLRALELGAVDFVTKPRAAVAGESAQFALDLAAKVRAAARAKLRVRAPLPAARPTVDKSAAAGAMLRTTNKVIAVGASTGGTDALMDLLTAMPADAPGIVIVQHMPEKFTKSFAERLDAACRIKVKEASDGDRVLTGHALIAPGGRQMELTRSGAIYGVRVFDGERVNRHRPSVDVLFESCARVAGVNCSAALLTGMGDDGARGMLALRNAGAHTVAQDEATCVVFGMPREAIALGAAEEVLALGDVGPRLLRLAA
jgi:two-component system chemotaxis response regulator CheB